MSDEDLEARALTLHAEGVTPKQIARALGVRPAQVSEWVRAGLARAAPTDELGALVGAWVNPGWSHGLGLEGEASAWRALDPKPEVGQGLVTVFLERQHRHGKVICSRALVDVWCLGVKNADGPQVMEPHESGALRTRVFGVHEREPVTLPLELLQALVLGAEAFARSIGISAHVDFEKVRPQLGPWEGPSPIRFGHDGQVEYIAGPHDDTGRILAILERTVGSGRFDFLTPVRG